MSSFLLPSLLSSPSETRSIDPVSVLPPPFLIDKNRTNLMQTSQEAEIMMHVGEQGQMKKKNIRLPSLVHMIDSQFATLTPLGSAQQTAFLQPVFPESLSLVPIPTKNPTFDNVSPTDSSTYNQKKKKNISHKPKPDSANAKHSLYLESLAKSILRQSNAYANNLAKKTTFEVRTERNAPQFDLSIFPDDEGSRIFKQLYEDKSVMINPKKLHFIPAKFWPDKDIPFCDIVDDFFRRKNHINCRFPHKLYNALRLNELGGKFKIVSGVEWLSPMVLRVDKIGFSRLLGISSIEGSLFHRQGNFTTHGFSEIGFDELTMIFGYQVAKQLVQNSDVRYLRHNLGIFKEGVTEEAIEACKWVSSKRKAGFY